MTKGTVPFGTLKKIPSALQYAQMGFLLKVNEPNGTVPFVTLLSRLGSVKVDSYAVGSIN